MKQAKAIKVLTALAQDTRINIFKLLIEQENGLSAGVIAEILKVPPATLSFHLMQMLNSGLLKSERQGRTITYFAKHKTIINLITFLNVPLVKE